MRKYNFQKTDAAFAQSAQRQFSELSRAVNSLRDNMNGLKRTLTVPVPKGGNRYTKTSRSNPSIFAKAGQAAVGSFVGRNVSSLLSGSFYTSSSQSSSLLMQALQEGERIL